MERLEALEAMSSEALQQELGEGVMHAALPSRDDLRAHLGVARDLSVQSLYPQAVSSPNLEAVTIHRNDPYYESDRRVLVRQFTAIIAADVPTTGLVVVVKVICTLCGSPLCGARNGDRRIM